MKKVLSITVVLILCPLLVACSQSSSPKEFSPPEGISNSAYVNDIAKILQRAQAIDSDIERMNNDRQMTLLATEEEIQILRGKCGNLKTDLENLDIPANYRDNYNALLDAFGDRLAFLTFYSEYLIYSVIMVAAGMKYEDTNKESDYNIYGESKEYAEQAVNNANSSWVSYRNGILSVAAELGITVNVPSVIVEI